MNNQSFRDAYNAAASELESLLRDQEKTEERILSLRKTMNALATLISQHDGKDKNFTEFAHAWLRENVDISLTGDIHKIINAAKEPLTASEIREELKELGGSLAEHRNPLATIHAILNRLSESGRVRETVRDGKKAWQSVLPSDNPAHRLVEGARFPKPVGNEPRTAWEAIVRRGEKPKK